MGASSLGARARARDNTPDGTYADHQWGRPTVCRRPRLNPTTPTSPCTQTRPTTAFRAYIGSDGHRRQAQGVPHPRRPRTQRRQPGAAPFGAPFVVQIGQWRGTKVETDRPVDGAKATVRKTGPSSTPSARATRQTNLVEAVSRRGVTDGRPPFASTSPARGIYRITFTIPLFRRSLLRRPPPRPPQSKLFYGSVGRRTTWTCPTGLLHGATKRRLHRTATIQVRVAASAWPRALSLLLTSRRWKRPQKTRARQQEPRSTTLKGDGRATPGLYQVNGVLGVRPHFPAGVGDRVRLGHTGGHRASGPSGRNVHLVRA